MARAGDLRDLATIQRRQSGTDDYGNVTTGGWAELYTVWADVMERPGGERIAAGALESTRMATIRVRRSSQSLAVTAADRIVVRGLVWNIRAIAEVGRARDLIEFTCENGVAT